MTKLDPARGYEEVAHAFPAHFELNIGFTVIQDSGPFSILLSLHDCTAQTKEYK